jgi:hypothetical protein
MITASYAGNSLHRQTEDLLEQNGEYAGKSQVEHSSQSGAGVPHSKKCVFAGLLTCHYNEQDSVASNHRQEASCSN